LDLQFIWFRQGDPLTQLTQGSLQVVKALLPTNLLQVLQAYLCAKPPGRPS